MPKMLETFFGSPRNGLQSKSEVHLENEQWEL